MNRRDDKLFQRRILQFTANAHKACPHCLAPGQYLSDPIWLKSYPAVYEPKRLGDPVGEICPCCGGYRSTTIERRTNRKEWWIVRLPNWMSRLMEILDPVKG